MSRFTLFLCALVLTLGGWQLGSWRGYSNGFAEGKLTVQAAHDNKAVGDLTHLISSGKALVAEANKTSVQLRADAAKRQQVDQQFLKGFDDALLKTADSRHGCVFEPSLMRQLGDARQRAADAATGLPGSAGAAVRPSSRDTGGKR